MVEQAVVGIDVSKAKLDVAIWPGGEQFTVSNDRHGLGELLRRMSPLAPGRVVLEATGNLNSWRSVSWRLQPPATGSTGQSNHVQHLTHPRTTAGNMSSARCAGNAS